VRITFAASECVPFSKTGGLADVVGALPQALAKSGHQVTVFLPVYRQTRLTSPRTVIASITVPFDDRYRFVSVVDGGKQGGVQYYFIIHPPFFDREHLYGTPLGDYHDNAERFALYCRAVLEASKILGVPDIFHCHDWQAALIPILLETLYVEDPAFRTASTIFTIHNIAYQGIFPPETLSQLLLPADLFSMSKLEFYGKVSFLKGALIYADLLTTVSPRYAKEIQTPEFGFGLEGVLHGRADQLTGIINGVDYYEWGPEADKFTAQRYSAEDTSGKPACRRDLLKQFAMPVESKAPVIGIVSRFVAQKGFDLFAEVAEQLAAEDVIVVALGAGDELYEDMFRRLVKAAPQKFAVRIAYDNPLAHKIEAGADMFLMPSRYEPCGMNQIYSLKYGTVPIVSAVGGLDDTIEHWNPETGKGNGFKFTEYTAEALLEAIRTALKTFQDKGNWRKIMRNGMACEFSWTTAARQYLHVYERARGLRTTK